MVFARYTVYSTSYNWLATTYTQFDRKSDEKRKFKTDKVFSWCRLPIGNVFRTSSFQCLPEISKLAKALPWFMQKQHLIYVLYVRADRAFHMTACQIFTRMLGPTKDDMPVTSLLVRICVTHYRAKCQGNFPSIWKSPTDRLV